MIEVLASIALLALAAVAAQLSGVPIGELLMCAAFGSLASLALNAFRSWRASK